MQLKKVLGVVTGFAILLSFLAGTTLAKSDNQPTIPEVNGVYDDPGHPGIKVRVFVHQAKPTNNGSHKPNPSPTPIPQCVSVDDPGSNAVDNATGWKLPSQWTYNLNPTSVPSSVGSQNLATIASDAFGAWSSSVGGKVSFSEGTDTTATRQAYDQQNIVAWGRTNGSALAVTYTRYNSTTKQVVDVDTIMNSKFAWMWSDTKNCAYPNAYDAQDILTHELGHWMGLDDHYTSDYTNNTMYGYGSTQEVKKDTLTNGDTQGAQAVYQ